MIKTVVSIGLFVDEKMEIKKNRLMPQNPTGKEKRIAIVTGIHGDELDGQYVCYELIRRIQENQQCLNGIVDLYPALNPLGIESVTRGIPLFDMDMNRIFPGSEDGAVAEYVAAKIMEDISGADMCVDIHSSNIYLRELPQVRLSESSSELLLPYAKLLNMDFIWIHPTSTVMQASLSHSLNAIGVPTLVVEMGVGMRITKTYCMQLVDGLYNLMEEMGIIEGIPTPTKEPIVSTKGHVGIVNATTSGFFIPSIGHTFQVKEGDHLGDIINPLKGTIEETIVAPCSGTVFTLREYPVVYTGSLIARILGGHGDD